MLEMALILEEESLTRPGNAGGTNIEFGRTEKEVIDVGRAAGTLMKVRIEHLNRAERASVEEKAAVSTRLEEEPDTFN